MMNPVLSPPALQEAESILAIIADPEAAKKRLAQIKAASAEMQKRLDEAVRLEAEAGAQWKAAEDAKAMAERVAEDHRKQAAIEDEALSHREQHVANRETALAQRELNTDTALNKRKAELDDRESTLNNEAASQGAYAIELGMRAAEVKRREESLTSMETAAAQLKADYEQRMAQLKNLVA